MKIVQVIPSPGDAFYCENCLRDLALVRALRTAGVEVLAVPLYLPPLGLPLREGEFSPIFFGGINVWLQQKLAIFRKTPRLIDRLLDARPLLRLAGRLAGLTSPEDLAATTMSMLRGPKGRQAKELDRLVAYLRLHDHPEIVVLSNALLLGMAKPIREALGCRVVCFLQDEDEFVDALPAPLAAPIWELMARQAADADMFIASSRYYAQAMTARLSLPPDRVRVIYDAIDPPADLAARPPERPVIGYLSRICQPKGLDLLVEAFLDLRRHERFAGLRLRAAGGWTAADRPFIDQLRKRLASQGATADVEFLPTFVGPERWNFLAGLSVFSVPSRRGEAAGLCVLEAMASGVPVVQPASGLYPELIELTGGGRLFEPGDVHSLTDQLAALLADPAAARQMGAAGRKAVLQRFSATQAAAELVTLYRTIVRP